jgi:hypothetical protein
MECGQRTEIALSGAVPQAVGGLRRAGLTSALTRRLSAPNRLIEGWMSSSKGFDVSIHLLFHSSTCCTVAISQDRVC